MDLQLLINNTKLVAGEHYKSFSDKTPAGKSFQVWKTSKCFVAIQVEGQKVKRFRIYNGNGVCKNRNLMARLKELCQGKEQAAKAAA